MVRSDERFKIPDRFTLIPAGPDEYRLHSLGFSLSLRGRSSELLTRLLPLLDGEATVADIVGRLDGFNEETVGETLDYLLNAGALERVGQNHNGILSAAEAQRFQPQISFLSHFIAPAGVPAADSVPRSGLEYQERIKRSRVKVFGLGRLGSPLVRALTLAGVGEITGIDSEQVGDRDLNSDAWFTTDHARMNRAEAARCLAMSLNPAVKFEAVSEPIESAELQESLAKTDFAVLCRDDFNPAEYEAFNHAALASKTSWTSARMSGFEFQIGPTVIPFETACFQCFDLRQKSNVPDFAEYKIVEDFLKKDRLRPESLAFTPGVGLLALEVLKAITWFMAPATRAHLYSLNLLTMESKLHPILKIPRCPACGRPAKPRPTIHAWQQSPSS
jgi:bacteriocin biosynthesis cyclodehydratase domain-containing protein